MNDTKIIRWTGIFGIVGTLLAVIEIPLWIIPGEVPPLSEAVAFSEYIANSRVIVLTRVLMDILIVVCYMIFFSGFRHLICKAGKEFEWIGTLNFAASIMWWMPVLIAGGLEGSAALDTIGGKTDPTVVRALVEGTLLFYNGPIFLATMALFMGTAGYAVLTTAALPRWIGWLGWFIVVLCFLFVPAMYRNVLDYNDFYNLSGWGSGYVAGFSTLSWTFSASVAMIRKSYSNQPKASDSAEVY